MTSMNQKQNWERWGECYTCHYNIHRGKKGGKLN